MAESAIDTSAKRAVDCGISYCVHGSVMVTLNVCVALAALPPEIAESYQVAGVVTVIVICHVSG